MIPIVTRRARFADTEAMRAVAIESYIKTFADSNTPENMEAFLSEVYSLEKLEAEFYEPGSVLFLASEAEVVIGFLRLRLNDEVSRQLGTNTIELQRLYIHSMHQGKKAGYLLMEKAMEYAKTTKFDWIWLGVWERNFVAQKFYQRWGFERFGEHVFQMGDDPQIDWVLKKNLK